VLLAVAAYGALAAPADQLDRLRGDGLATLFYGANWRFIASGQSYFDLFSAASPLRHMWSLAIEEQFYLVWPLITFACLRLARGRHWLLALVCGAGAGVSIATMAALYDPVDPSRAYYGTDSRAHLLFIGAGLALVLARWRPRGAARSGVHALGLAGALACVGFWTLVPDTAAWMYRGGYAVFGVCVALVITSAVQPGRFALRSFLSLAPLVWIGRISYGLYLWHWPVIVVASPARTGLDGPSLTILRLGLTFTFATASFYLVEQPIRRGALKGRWAMAMSPSAFIATGVVVIVATAGAAPLPVYLQNGPGQLTSRASQLPKPETQPAPSPAAAYAAPAGVPTAPPPKRIMLVGDSVAESLLEGLREAATEQGVQVYPASVPGCGIIGGQPIDVSGTPFKWSATCEREVPKYQMARLAQIRPDVVLWLSEWDRDDRAVNGQNVSTTTISGRSMFAQLIDDAASRLTSTGARLVMMTVAPPSPSDASPDPPKDPKFDYMNRMLRDYARAHADHTSVVDLAGLLCPNGSQPCPEEVSGVRPRPRDGNHFEPDTAVWVAHQLMPQIMAATPGTGIEAATSNEATTNASVGKRA
jgi:peptidoglycan/LPS O-acetylase OafA/YrhL